MNLKIQKKNGNAIIPKYQTSGSAGFDFHSTIKTVVSAGETKLIPTGIAMEIPIGFEVLVRPRSGLSLKTGIRVANAPGTIDSDFRDEIMVILYNQGPLPFEISVGDRIAQGVVCPVIQADFIEVNGLSNTERKGGFGSTGK